MMDCSHSMAEEDTVGQTGGSSYAASEKANDDMSPMKTLSAALTEQPTLPHVGARKFLRKVRVYIAAHHEICCKFSPPVKRILVQRQSNRILKPPWGRYQTRENGPLEIVLAKMSKWSKLRS
jgi:hypothetical protein